MESRKFSKILADATTLEVSSLLADSISGRKFPGVSRAFLETVSAWAYQVDQLVTELGIEIGPKNENNQIVYSVKEWSKKKKDLFDLVADARSAKEENEKFPSLADHGNIKNLLNTEDMNKWRQQIFCTPPFNETRNNKFGPVAFRLLKLQDRLDRLRRRFKTFFEAETSTSEMEERRPQQGISGFWGCLKSVFCSKNGIFKKAHDPPAHYVMELRKLWELKDGFIFAQHTIQLDGDVINRYNIHLYRQNIEKREIPQLLEFHHKNVDIGLKQWQYLIKTIVEMAKVVGEKLVSVIG
jgi:hypothetical protein